MLIALSSLSQTVTKVDDSTVILHSSTMKSIIKDLIAKDQCDSVLEYTQQTDSLLKKVVADKDSIILNINNQLRLESDLFTDKNGELTISENSLKALQKKYTELKVNDRVKMGFATMIILGLVYFIIK